MRAAPWWLSHLWIILIQIIAFVPYVIGSRKFYKNQSDAMLFIGIGILLDVAIAISASSGILPRMSDGQEAPWQSVLFITHIATAGIGMFGFITLFMYVLAKRRSTPLLGLRNFQYKVLLPLWCFGVMIALANFLCKVAFNVRLYDIL